MVDAAPLEVLRYDPAVAGNPAATSAPAYDLIEPIPYAQHRTANPYTVLELMAPDEASRRSRTLLEQWRRSGVLVPEEPAFFLYEEHELVGGLGAEMLHVQRGVLAAVRLEPSDGGSILPHEEVDDEHVAARLRLLEALRAELDPVYCVLEDPPPALTRLLTGARPGPPVVAASDERGTDHRIWALRDPVAERVLREALAGTRAMIADGHHRYARSLAYRDRRRAEAVPTPPEDPPWERVFAYLVDPDAGGPRIEAMHRLLAPVTADQLGVLAEDFALENGPSDPHLLLAQLADTSGHAFGLIEPGGRGLLLRARDEAALRSRLPPGRSETWKELDAAILLYAVLPALGLERGSVSIPSGIEEAVAQVSGSDDAALVLMRPPDFRSVARLAAAGERLPYKSTRFLPKPRTGLLIRPLDGSSPA